MNSYTQSYRIIQISVIIFQLSSPVAEAFSASHHAFVTSTSASSSASSASAFTTSEPSSVRRKFTANGHHHHSLSTTLFQQSQYKSSYDVILESIDEIFPPNLLDQRIALSRKDGYWPFISEGEDPPQEFVYGEFDVDFFCHAIDRARELHPNPQVFCDLGSGTGRLVLVGAALGDWKLVRGIELLPGIHEQAVEKLEACRRQGGGGGGGVDASNPSSSSSSSSPTPSVAAAGVSADSTPSNSMAGGTDEPPPVASGSDLDDYWKQYKQFSAAPSSPNDDWLNQLSNTLNDDDDDDDDNEEDVTDGGLYLPNTNTNPENSVSADGTSDQNDGTLSYSTNNNDHGANNNAAGNEYALGSKHQLPLAPIQLSCGSFDDPYEFFGDADIIFCFSSAMPYHIMIDMARAVGRQSKVGTLVLTTEYRLPEGGTIDPADKDPRVPFGNYELELVEELNGTNEATGGESTVFVHRVTKSFGTGEPISRPEPNVSDMCYDAIQSLQENDPQRFLRQVSNQMMFLGLPDSWLPKLNDDTADDGTPIIM